MPGSLFSFLIVLFVSVKSVYSYEITADFSAGYYWRELPISFSVVDDPECDKEVVEKLTNALELAIEEWERALEGKYFIWKIGAPLSQVSPSANNVYWEKNFTEVTGLSNKYLAIAIRYTLVPYITRVEIVMNASYIHLPIEDLKQVLIHELGHTIGLDHTSSTDSIMSEAISFGGRTSQKITNDDIEGVGWIVEENRKRQLGTSKDPHYLTLEESSRGSDDYGMGCGTIENLDGNGPSNGSSNFIISLLVGLLMALLGKNFASSLIKY